MPRYETTQLLDAKAVTAASSTSLVIEVPDEGDELSLQLVWNDATSNASNVPIYVSNQDDAAAPADGAAVDLQKWSPAVDTNGDPITMTGPDATAAGSSLLVLSALPAKKVLFRYEASANSNIDLFACGGDLSD